MDPTLLLSGGIGAAALAGWLAISATGRLGRTATETIAAPRPGWVARRRARKGVTAKPGHVGVGWRSGTGPVHLELAALRHHGYVGGAPGSGKTTLLRTIISHFPGPVIVLDAKGSPDLPPAVYDAGGLVWEVGGPLRLDVLDDEPSILAQQLLEGETFTDRAAVYRAIAEHAVQRAATVLEWQMAPREPARILELLASPTVLREAIRDTMPPGDAVAKRWLVELDDPSRTMVEGFQTFSERLGVLLDSPAGRSLGTGPTSIRLNDVLATGTKLLIRLDPRYGQISRKVGAWALVAMLRMAAELRQARWSGQCLFVVDEPRLLGHEGRHLVDLFGTARDAGIGLVVADQGVAGLSAVHPDLPNAVLRLTGWQMVFRQGAPDDAEQMSKLFGKALRQDVSHSSDGRTQTRQVEAPRVPANWLLRLPTAHAWVRSAPIGVNARELVESVVVAMPPPPSRPALPALPAPARVSTDPQTDGVTPLLVEVHSRVDRVSAAELAKANVKRLITDADENGCRHWRGSFDEDGRPRAWWLDRYRATIRLLATWEHGELSRNWDVHHTCLHRWCVEVKHLEPLPRHEHHRVHAEIDRAAVEGPAEVVPVLGRPERAKALRGKGRTLRQIAEELKVSYETVRKDLRDDGLTGVDKSS